eukprot:SAG31_NODE_41459_length_276_cov_0.581921_2_plen_54_part_01
MLASGLWVEKYTRDGVLGCKRGPDSSAVLACGLLECSQYMLADGLSQNDVRSKA